MLCQFFSRAIWAMEKRGGVSCHSKTQSFCWTIISGMRAKYSIHSFITKTRCLFWTAISRSQYDNVTSSLYFFRYHFQQNTIQFGPHVQILKTSKVDIQSFPIRITANFHCQYFITPTSAQNCYYILICYLPCLLLVMFP